ncbi:MAG: XRE family transcriptional regulator [Rhizomicrobium sp.]
MVGIGENLKAARLKRGISQRELGKRVGLTQTAISELEAGRATSTPKIHDIAKELNVTPEWLEGKGQPLMLPSSAVNPSHTFSGNIIELGGTEFARIPVFDVRFSAGFGAQNDEVQPFDYHEMRVTALRHFTDAPIDKLVFLRVSGDSMEPLLFNRDWVLIDASRTNLVSPAIYAIVYEGEGFLKHASRDIETGAVSLVSRNPVYPPQTIPHPEGLRIIGRVVLSLHMH